MNRNNGRNMDGTFAKGNPGKPQSARHRATKAVAYLFDGSAEALPNRQSIWLWAATQRLLGYAWSYLPLSAMMPRLW